MARYLTLHRRSPGRRFHLVSDGAAMTPMPDDVTPEPGTQATECVETDWSRDGKGYGIKYHMGRNLRAHRWAWELANGPIPVGMFVCHHCDNPPCVNVAHLFLGTPADNMHDRDAKGRAATGERNGSTRRRGVPRHGRSAPQPGSANGRAKLAEADIYAIRNRHAAGELNCAIAADYGMSRSTIGRIVNGRYWSHV